MKDRSAGLTMWCCGTRVRVISLSSDVQTNGGEGRRLLGATGVIVSWSTAQVTNRSGAVVRLAHVYRVDHEGGGHGWYLFDELENAAKPLPIAFRVPPPNADAPETQAGYVAGMVMFGGVNATVDWDPGDEDHRR